MKIGVYISATGITKKCRDLLYEELKVQYSASEVAILEKGQHTDIGFSYHLSEPILDTFLQQLSRSEIKVETIYLHLPSEISGINDLYDLSDKGSLMESTLLDIEGIIVAHVSANGVVKLETNPLKGQDEIVLKVTNALLDFKNDISD